MIEFFKHYTLESAIVMLFMLGVALKEGYELIQYFRNKNFNQLNTIQKKEQKIQHALDGITSLERTHQHDVGRITDALNTINDKLDDLMKSDRDAIKSWIIMLYRKYKKDSSAFDSMEMDLLERRYGHYKTEGGNSYIDNIMDELRQIYNNKEDSDASV